MALQQELGSGDKPYLPIPTPSCGPSLESGLAYDSLPNDRTRRRGCCLTPKARSRFTWHFHLGFLGHTLLGKPAIMGEVPKASVAMATTECPAADTSTESPWQQPPGDQPALRWQLGYIRP